MLFRVSDIKKMGYKCTGVEFRLEVLLSPKPILMKQKITMLVALFMCFTLSTFSAVAATPLKAMPVKVSSFDFLRGHRQGSDVSLSWAVAAEGVQSFRIERSSDGEFFDEVETVAAAPKTNRYLDTGVYPGTNYYRVVAVLADGSTIESSVIVVRIIKRA